MNDILTKLNINKNDKYVSGRPMTLAHEYYMKNYDKNIYSHCSPQLYDILTSNMCMNSPVNEFFDRYAETAFDVNKQYTSILYNCDEYGWAVFAPTDEVELFDGDIETGLYFINTERGYPMRGNGWYWDGFVSRALDDNIINKSDIIYQIKAMKHLPSNHFQQFVKDIYIYIYIYIYMITSTRWRSWGSMGS